MTLLLSCREITQSFAGHTLFQKLSFGIFSKERVGLIGPNGSGKSTLLKILAKLQMPEQGEVIFSRGLRIGYVAQENEFCDQPLTEVLKEAKKKENYLSAEEEEAHIHAILSRLGFKDLDVSAQLLSGGWKKRLAIACELVNSPDLLFLDEPTNHLDLEGVIWLETFLQTANFAFVVISHDRHFLENSVNRMMELNASYPDYLFSVQGSYTLFLQKKAEFLAGQMQQERSLSSKVRYEMQWLQQNPKARTTKSRSRTQEAHQLIGNLGELQERNQVNFSQIDFSATARGTQKLLVATNLTMSIAGQKLFSQVNFTLSPRVRLAILGKNGSGKTTLLRILAGELAADKGGIKCAEGIKIVYFDQHRDHLPKGITLKDALTMGQENVLYQGRSVHVNAWCQRFLFSPGKLDLPFERLSGGEKARVHLARLMLQPADILLLDEPTNDLDIPTLEILEESLLNFPGAVVVISHDRYMIDRISTAVLGLGKESAPVLFADYRQWEAAQVKEKRVVPEKKARSKESSENFGPTMRKKMTYSEKKEWEQIESKIENCEKEIEQLQQEVEQLTDSNQLSTKCEQLAQKQKELDHFYHRWEELEKINN